MSPYHKNTFRPCSANPRKRGESRTRRNKTQKHNVWAICTVHASQEGLPYTDTEIETVNAKSGTKQQIRKTGIPLPCHHMQ